MNNNNDHPTGKEFEEQIRNLRLNKLKQVNPEVKYPNTFQPTHTASQLEQLYPYKEEDAQNQPDPTQVFSLAGRALALRQMGKAFFIDLHDHSGKIQLYANQKKLDDWEILLSLDLGDIIGVSGTLFFTRTKMLTLNINSIELVSKCLLPMPEKFSGIKDTEIRYRQRYLHLATDRSARSMFTLRSQIIQNFRSNLIAKEYIEVETPMMHNIQGGASAKPFTTHYNALDRDFYLRVAPELHLKRLLVGGYNKVFEINRNFRNEGISTKHSPEFTMLEWYTSFSDFSQAMDLTESLLRSTLQERGVPPTAKTKLDQTFERFSMLQLVAKYSPLDEQEVDSDALIKFVSETIKPTDDWGTALLFAFEHLVEAKLENPTFVYQYPASQSPLARPNDQEPKFADRWELFIQGREIANGYSELNDPEVQAAYMHRQVEASAQGDEEAMEYDKDYINALSYGMPPAAGVGVGIDRWIMLVTEQQSIRDVVLFPHLKF